VCIFRTQLACGGGRSECQPNAMDRNELIMMLQADDPESEPVPILVADLAKLTCDDSPTGVRIQPCLRIESVSLVRAV
jgi:hypothetical protein